MKKLGIIGGMGPAATADFYLRIVNLTDAPTDQDHIEVDIISRPQVPDRTAFILNEPGAQDFTEDVKEIVTQLESLGCEILAMPCNSAHARFDEIKSALTSATLLNILDETASYLASQGLYKVGILATDGAKQSNVYPDEFQKFGVECIFPTDPSQKLVMDAIYKYVKAGQEMPRDYLDSVLRELEDAGAEAIILGCTEVSLLDFEGLTDLPVIDTMDVLAVRSIEACGARVRSEVTTL